jgi:hypothetical protein
MAPTNDDVDLAPSVAAGYKVTEKKTVSEYAALDAKYPLRCETPCLHFLVMSLSKSGKQALELRTR